MGGIQIRKGVPQKIQKLISRVGGRLLFGTGEHMWKEKQKQNPAMFVTKQCWSPRYKISVLSTYGGCHPEGFTVASFCNFNYIANNHDNNSNNNDTNNKLSSCINFHQHIFYFSVSIFLHQFR